METNGRAPAVDVRTVFVSDDARVVRYSDLVNCLEELGSVGMVAQHYGVDPSTISRQLTLAGVPNSPTRRIPRRMAEEIDRLQEQHRTDEDMIEEQRTHIESLERQLENGDQAH